jgi:hypothetical protein
MPLLSVTPSKRLPVSSVEKLMVARFAQDHPVIRTLQQENEALRNLVMAACAKLHQREHMPAVQPSLRTSTNSTSPEDVTHQEKRACISAF